MSGDFLSLSITSACGQPTEDRKTIFELAEFACRKLSSRRKVYWQFKSDFLCLLSESLSGGGRLGFTTIAQQ